MKDFQQFLKQLQTDEALQKKLEEAGKNYSGEQNEENVFNSVILPIAKEAGYDITLEDLKKGATELDPDEMAQVEGGGGFGAAACLVFGIGIGMPISDGAGALCLILGGGKGASACAGEGVGALAKPLRKKDVNEIELD